MACSHHRSQRQCDGFDDAVAFYVADAVDVAYGIDVIDVLGDRRGVGGFLFAAGLRGLVAALASVAVLVSLGLGLLFAAGLLAVGLCLFAGGLRLVGFGLRLLRAFLLWRALILRLWLVVAALGCFRRWLGDGAVG
ncbi:MAG: hypothetical protein K2N16_08560, partial [Muribaculaceae bacterium]|nr:hypothetical protein [Muribaculaceae bacterium]